MDENLSVRNTESPPFLNQVDPLPSAKASSSPNLDISDFGAELTHLSIPGLRSIRSQFIPELRGKQTELVHEKTGAIIQLIENSDDLLHFSCGFRTPPPSDNSGLPHCTEHERLKNKVSKYAEESLAVEINAATYRGFTTFYGSTRDRGDLNNIVTLLMSGIFSEEVLQIALEQDVWRVEPDPRTGGLRLNGRLFNEMSGVYSNPFELIAVEAYSELFSDLITRFYSAGHPLEVPNVTTDSIREYFARWYHPSNSLVVIYGSGNHLSTLEKIVAEFDRFQLREFDPQVLLHKSGGALPEPRRVFKSYPVEPGVPKDAGTVAELCWRIPARVSRSELELLHTVLFALPESPLNHMVASRLCERFEGELEIYDAPDHVFRISITTDDSVRVIKVEEKTLEVLRNLSHNGLSRQLVLDALDETEFALRLDLLDPHRGQDIIEAIISGGFNGADPFTVNRFFDDLSALRKRVVSGEQVIEELIERCLLSNPNRLLIGLSPSTQLHKDWNMREQEIIQNHTGESRRMSEPEIIKEWRATAKNLDDIDRIQTRQLPKAERSQLSSEQSGKVRLYDADTQGFVGVNLSFDISNVPQNLLPYLSLAIEALFSDVYFTNGGGAVKEVYTSTDFSTRYASQEPACRLFINGCTFKQQAGLVIDSIFKQLRTIEFDSARKLEELLTNLKSDTAEGLLGESINCASVRAESKLGQAGCIEDIMEGVGWAYFISDRLDNHRQLWRETSENMRRALQIMIESGDPQAALVGDSQTIEEFAARVNDGIGNWPTQRVERRPIELDLNKNEGFASTSSVFYIVQVLDFDRAGLPYSGTLDVLDYWLKNAFLWPSLSIAQGAYASGLDRDFDSNLLKLTSSEDIDIVDTFKVWRAIPEALAGLAGKVNELRRCKIRAIADLEEPADIFEKAQANFSARLAGFPDDFLQLRRDRILSTTQADCEAYITAIRKAQEHASTVVFGSPERLMKAKKHLTENLIIRALPL